MEEKNLCSEKENQTHKMSNLLKELLEKFQSAETIEESLDLFKNMEESNSFPESSLGVLCWPLALQLHREGNNSEKVLSLGKRALDCLVTRENSNNIPCSKSSTHFHHLNYFIAQVLSLLGFAAFDLRKYLESFGCFERADKMLGELLESNSCPGDCVLSQLESVQIGLFKVKSSMGKNEEAVTNIRKVVEIGEKTREEGCLELGEIYHSAYKAYLAVVDFKEALPFCLKALEIFKKHMGCDSKEVGGVMEDLGFIYSELDENEKALEHNLLAHSIMKKVAQSSSDFLNVELMNGNMLNDNGHYEEAIEVLKGVASHAEVEGIDKAHAFGGMAKAAFSLGRFDDAKKYMRTGQRIYEKEEIDPCFAAFGFEDMSRLYEKMNDYETAISLVRRVIAIPKIPQKLLLEASMRLFELTSLVGKKEEAIPYMEDAVEKLEASVDSMNYVLGFSYKKLGVAYKKSGQPELALKCLTKAKEVMDVYHGPYNLESLETSHKLAATYAAMERVEPAIEIEEKVIEGLKILGSSGEEFLPEAVGLLNNLNGMKELMASPAWSVVNAFAKMMR